MLVAEVVFATVASVVATKAVVPPFAVQLKFPRPSFCKMVEGAPWVAGNEVGTFLIFVISPTTAKEPRKVAAPEASWRLSLPSGCVNRKLRSLCSRDNSHVLVPVLESNSGETPRVLFNFLISADVEALAIARRILPLGEVRGTHSWYYSPMKIVKKFVPAVFPKSPPESRKTNRLGVVSVVST